MDAMKIKIRQGFTFFLGGKGYISYPDKPPVVLTLTTEEEIAEANTQSWKFEVEGEEPEKESTKNKEESDVEAELEEDLEDDKEEKETAPKKNKRGQSRRK